MQRFWSVSITGCYKEQWCFFHGNESTSLRFTRKDAQSSSSCCNIFTQAYQKGSACQSSIQAILLRKPRPKGQAQTFYEGNQDSEQNGRYRCRREEVQSRFGKILKHLLLNKNTNEIVAFSSLEKIFCLKRQY